MNTEMNTPKLIKKMNVVLSSSSLNDEFKARLTQFVNTLQTVFSKGDNDFVTHVVGYKFMKKDEYVLICDETHYSEGSIVEQAYCAINVKTGGIHNAISHNSYTKSSVANIHKPDSYAHADYVGYWLSQLNRGNPVVVIQ